LLRWHLDRSRVPGEEVGSDICLLTIVMLWNLLVFYHRRYDYVAAISFPALIIFMLDNPQMTIKLSNTARTTICCLTGVIMAFWILPIYRIMGDSTYRYLFNTCTIAALAISTWILFRLVPFKLKERRCQHVQGKRCEGVPANSSDDCSGSKV
jgi:bacteriorhodopsin